jgi:hypothetical protein
MYALTHTLIGVVRQRQGVWSWRRSLGFLLFASVCGWGALIAAVYAALD